MTSSEGCRICVCGVSRSMGTWSVSLSISVSDGIDRFVVDCHGDSQRVSLISLFFGRCLHCDHGAGFSYSADFSFSFTQWCLHLSFFFIFLGLQKMKNKTNMSVTGQLRRRVRSFPAGLRLCQCWCNVVGKLSLSGSIRLILSPR